MFSTFLIEKLAGNASEGICIQMAQTYKKFISCFFLVFHAVYHIHRIIALKHGNYDA